jgi:hypothetical protein
MDYTGVLSEFVKAVPALMMLAALTYPAWGFLLALMASRALGEPGCYVVYALWWGQWVAVGAYVAYVNYKP